MSKAKRNVIIISAVLLAAVTGGVVGGVKYFSHKDEPQIPSDTLVTELTYLEENLEDWSSTVVYNGKTYTLKDDVKTVLLL